MNKLREKYPEEIQKHLNKYPPDQKRSAVMPLLYLAQREGGHVSNHDIDDIAEICGISTSEVASIIGFYTLYHDKPEGEIRIQVCTDLPCALRGADKFLADLCDTLGIQPGETTPDGLVTVEPVMCLAACDKAPIFQTQTGDGIEYHENMTVELTLDLIDQWRGEIER
ncbi:MAG TPA: NAD(P)H-dependent oxidoreductase subunit E [Anaerolineales bacterium]|nr:NAD(P)H-dependent oxidoreductase subunit E [Anaerolineales bacterium]